MNVQINIILLIPLCMLSGVGLLYIATLMGFLGMMVGAK